MRRDNEASVVDRLVDSLRSAVLEGRLVGGQRLVESDITEEYDVSRGPVRIALGRLAAEGLVEILPHRGARVRRFTPEELLFLFEMREVMEGLAARVAARRRHATPGFTARLTGLHADMEQALAAGRPEEYLRINREFHDLILDAAGNPTLSMMVRQLQTQALRTLLQYRMDVDLLARSHDDHDHIVQAIVSGDEEGAEAAMRAHIRAARDEFVGPLGAVADALI